MLLAYSYDSYCLDDLMHLLLSNNVWLFECFWPQWSSLFQVQIWFGSLVVVCFKFLTGSSCLLTLYCILSKWKISPFLWECICFLYRQIIYCLCHCWFLFAVLWTWIFYIFHIFHFIICFQLDYCVARPPILWLWVNVWVSVCLLGTRLASNSNFWVCPFS